HAGVPRQRVVLPRGHGQSVRDGRLPAGFLHDLHYFHCTSQPCGRGDRVRRGRGGRGATAAQH
ncbi:hypothetical protein ABTL87_19555, partial [Acinetobacter baumannii]